MKFNPFISALIVFISLGALPNAFYAQKQNAPPTRIVVSATPEKATKTRPPSAEQQRRIDTFLKVWQTLNDNYFDQTFNGLDWNKIKLEYLPLATKAKTDL